MHSLITCCDAIFVVPVVLVGNKKDLRTDKCITNTLAKITQVPKMAAPGDAMTRKTGAYAYCECSAFLDEGIMEVFLTVIQAIGPLKKEHNKSRTVQWA